MLCVWQKANSFSDCMYVFDYFDFDVSVIVFIFKNEKKYIEMAINNFVEFDFAVFFFQYFTK